MPIKVENLTHIYSKNSPFESIALKDISFTINDGELIGLIGHTGSGKSTLVQHLNGLIKADFGKILIDDCDITQKNINMLEIRKKVGIVFQYPEYQLFEETVYKDIAFGPSNVGKTSEEINKIIHEVISLVGLPQSILEKSPFELSGGQKRRVAIAGVLAMEPEILILDEPTAGLDPAARNNILRLINDLHKTKNITIILVSHSMEDIARIADKVMVMFDGSLVMFDTTANVFSKADELRAIGLNVPQISIVMNELRKKGIKLPDGIYTVEDAFEAFSNYIKEKTNNAD